MSRHWPDFRRLWAAHSVSIFGDQLTLVALPLATYAETSSALAVGVVASAEAVTAVLFGLPAGAVADRLPYRRVLVLTDAGRLAILLALVVALRLDTGMSPLLAAAFGMGIVRVVHDAAANASIPLVVADDHLVAANGRIRVGGSVHRRRPCDRRRARGDRRHDAGVRRGRRDVCAVGRDGAVDPPSRRCAAARGAR